MTGTGPSQEQPEYIELQQALKLARVVESGGQAKYMIQNGEVKVNGVVETRRRRKLYPGDSFEVEGEVYHIGD
jgi:ribosome-associated protein